MSQSSKEEKKPVLVTGVIPFDETVSMRPARNLYDHLTYQMRSNDLINTEERRKIRKIGYSIKRYNGESLSERLNNFERKVTKAYAEILNEKKVEEVDKFLSEYVKDFIWDLMTEKYKEGIEGVKGEYYTTMWSVLPSEFLKYLTSEDHLDLDDFQGLELETRENEEGEIVYTGRRKRVMDLEERGRFKENVEENLEKSNYDPEWKVGIADSRADPLLDIVENPYLYVPGGINQIEEEESDIKTNEGNGLSVIESWEKFFEEIKNSLDNS